MESKSQKKYRLKNKEKIKQYQRKYSKNNREKINKRQNNYRQLPKSRELAKKYRQSAKYKEKERRYKQGRSYKEKQKLRDFAHYYLKDKILARDKKCVYCESKEKVELHHKKYTQNIKDIVAVCKKCHIKIHQGRLK